MWSSHETKPFHLNRYIFEVESIALIWSSRHLDMSMAVGVRCSVWKLATCRFTLVLVSSF